MKTRLYVWSGRYAFWTRFNFTLDQIEDLRHAGRVFRTSLEFYILDELAPTKDEVEDAYFYGSYRHDSGKNGECAACGTACDLDEVEKC